MPFMNRKTIAAVIAALATLAAAGHSYAASNDVSDIRREITKRQAVAMQATFHLKEMLAGQGAGRRGDPSSVENRPG